ARPGKLPKLRGEGRWAMAFVCWLAVLSAGVGPPSDTMLRDDPRVPDPIGLLTPGSGQEKRHLPPHECTIRRNPPREREALNVSLGQGAVDKTTRVELLNLGEVANGLWYCLPSDEPKAASKRIQSILASARLDHHKREEIVRAIKPRMTVRELHHALGVRADNALILNDRTVSFALGLVIAHDGAVVWEVSTIEAHVERDLEASYYRPGFNLSIGLLR